ncbi:MAG: hypothetical protein V4613_12245 [Bacteroidota bacterium]
MKFIKSTVLCLFASLLLLSCNKSQDAAKYNDQIIGYQTPIIEKMLELSKAIETQDSAAMFSKLQELNDRIDVSIAGMQKLEKFDDKTQLKEKMLKAFEFYKSISMNEYKTIIEIVAKPDDAVTTEDVELLNKIATEVSAKETEIDNQVEAAQKAFAKENNMELTDNKLQQEIDKK